MRKLFFEVLHEEMKLNPNIYFITADLGYGLADTIKEDYPDRFINCQAAEQAMLGIGIGLALQGKIPVCYSITPFLLHRPYEAIKLYLEGEGIPVKLVGSGRGKDYEHDGPSHFADDDSIYSLKFGYVNPEMYESMIECVKDILYSNKPEFLSLKR